MVFSVQELHIEYGARVLFKSLSFVVELGERIAFAGHNGSGKSTLMKCVAGIITPDSGRVMRPKYCDVGYLPQDGIHISGTSLINEVLGGVGDVVQLQTEIDEIALLLDKHPSSSEIYLNALEEIGQRELILLERDAATLRPRVESILRGLGFKQSDFERDCGEFSGGWQMRIALSKLLLQEPDILLLDEPTNHLDIQSQRWMEQYLRSYKGAICIISHDISLLDSLVTRTIAFQHGRAEEYSGNFSYFMRESAARKEILRRQAKSQEREIAKAQQFIDRFRAKASKATQAQSRMKQLAKVERIVLEDDDAVMNFKFPNPPHGGHVVAKLENVDKAYGAIKLLDKYNFTLEKGDRIAIVGVNGSGKSTFTRLISGNESPDSGECQMGAHTQIAFFSQTHADILDENATVFECVEAAASRETRPLARNILGCFLFRGDDIYKKIGVLSGGERSRVALVCMLLHPANFLIMDEPTNHLDFQSQEVLKTALLDYPGSYCIVSHNRQFLDPIVNKVLEFRNGLPPRLFLGNVSQYIEKVESDDKREKLEARAPKSSSPAIATATVTQASSAAAPIGNFNRRDQRRLEAQARKKRANLIAPLKKKLTELEEAISKGEVKKKQISLALSSPDNLSDNQRLMDLTQQYQQVERDESTFFSQWEDLSAEIERAESSISLELGT